MGRMCLAAALALATAGGPAWAAQGQVTPELERAVTRGLDYLASTQRPDGSWPGQYGQLSGVVGLSMMAFLAHGEQPGEGKYRDVIPRAVDFIISTQASNGLLAGKNQMSPMYSHGFATLALAEVYGMTDDKRVGKALEKAVGLILSSQAQNPQGAWRYSVDSRDADTTVAGSQMLALRAAATAGIEVPLEAVQKGVQFYKRCYCPGGGFGYTGNSGPNAIRAGIGLLILSLSGEYRSPEAKATADYLYYADKGTSTGGHFYYMCYYCSQAMRQAGGKYWHQWNREMTPRIMSLQQANGSWGGQGSTGAVLNTAMALLSIEINYDYLPIYQR